MRLQKFRIPILDSNLYFPQVFIKDWNTSSYTGDLFLLGTCLVVDLLCFGLIRIYDQNWFGANSSFEPNLTALEIVEVRTLGL